MSDLRLAFRKNKDQGTLTPFKEDLSKLFGTILKLENYKLTDLQLKRALVQNLINLLKDDFDVKFKEGLLAWEENLNREANRLKEKMNVQNSQIIEGKVYNFSHPSTEEGRHFPSQHRSRTRVRYSFPPQILIESTYLYKTLFYLGIIDKHKKPSSKTNIVIMEDSVIINYYRELARALLSFYGFCDNQKKLFHFIHFILKHSLWRTLAHKHKVSVATLLRGEQSRDLLKGRNLNLTNLFKDLLVEKAERYPSCLSLEKTKCAASSSDPFSQKGSAKQTLIKPIGNSGNILVKTDNWKKSKNKKNLSTANFPSAIAPRRLTLDPWWITGYTDGDASFNLNIVEQQTKVTLSVLLRFEIAALENQWNLQLLKQFNLFFDDLGRFRKNKSKNTIDLVFTSKEAIRKIIEHFKKYPCQTTKANNFFYFCRVSEIINKKGHLTVEGFYQILFWKSKFKLGLNEKLVKKSLIFASKLEKRDPVRFAELKTELLKQFSELPPIPTLEEPLNPYWISGFVQADGSFYVSKNKLSFLPTFSVGQHSRDTLVLERIQKILNCGNFFKNNKDSTVTFGLSSKPLIISQVIPFFERYPLFGAKRLDFLDFVTIIKLLETKPDSYKEQVKELCSKMNQRRKEDLDLLLTD